MTMSKTLPVAPKAPAKLPRGIIGKVHNSVPRSELPALPVPGGRERVSAFVDQSVVDRFEREAAGIRALERGDNVITIFDVIGEDFWSEGVTAKSIARQLKAIGGAVEVQINSPGGDVFEGFAIYNILREHPYPVTVKVLGMAASAASIIAMAADPGGVEIGESAFIMIHNCWVLAIGNRHDLRETADFLEPFDKALRDVYVARTGQTDAQVAAWLDKETYMNGPQAIERGFADALLPSDQVQVDEEAATQDRETNAIRSMERTLVASGLSRAQARERIQLVKASKPGAAPSDPTAAGTPGAADNQTDLWQRAMATEGRELLAALKR
jgi:ATP-dependent protease ClpP protease subunit